MKNFGDLAENLGTIVKEKVNEKKLGLDNNKTFWADCGMKAKSNKEEETTKPIEINLAGLVEGELIVKMHEDRPSACTRCVLAVDGDSTRLCPDVLIGKSRTLLCTSFGVGSYFIKKEDN